MTLFDRMSSALSITGVSFFASLVSPLSSPFLRPPALPPFLFALVSLPSADRYS